MYGPDVTPNDVIRQTWRWFPAAVIVLAVVLVLGGAVTLVCWQAGWWFAGHNATRQYELTQNGTSNQDTLRAQMTAQLANVATITTQIAATKDDPSEVTALQDQRAAVAGIACSDAAQVTGVPLPAQQAQWVSVNCSAGSVSPSSPLYVTGAP